MLVTQPNLSCKAYTKVQQLVIFMQVHILIDRLNCSIKLNEVGVLFVQTGRFVQVHVKHPKIRVIKIKLIILHIIISQ